MSSPLLSTDLNLFLQASFEACEGASRILNSYFGNLRKVDEKYQAGLVSEADRESEKFIQDLLKERFPEHSFLGEETGLSTPATSVSEVASGRRGAIWIVDPLDGTTNYVHQFPVFCISIGLEIDGELVLGVVDAPKMGLRYHALKGRGAFLNGEPIHASARSVLKDGLFATGFSSQDHDLDEQLAMIARLVRESRGIRRAGAAALDLCFVAQGVFDVFWEKNLSPWDTAAGVVIAREAGAIVTDMEGGVFEPRLRSILCGNPALHSQTLALFKEIHSEVQSNR